jgi:hypothetical protein
MPSRRDCVRSSRSRAASVRSRSSIFCKLAPNRFSGKREIAPVRAESWWRAEWGAVIKIVIQDSINIHHGRTNGSGHGHSLFVILPAVTCKQIRQEPNTLWLIRAGARQQRRQK